MIVVFYVLKSIQFMPAVIEFYLNGVICFLLKIVYLGFNLIETKQGNYTNSKKFSESTMKHKLKLG